jgi:poly-D-alanine transfer protein DltD
MTFTSSVNVSNKDIAQRLRDEVIRQINQELRDQGFTQYSDFRVDEDLKLWGKHLTL